jgi:hypothetical protein
MCQAGRDLQTHHLPSNKGDWLATNNICSRVRQIFAGCFFPSAVLAFIYIYIYIYIFICIFVCLHVYIYIYICIYVHLDIYTTTYARTHNHIDEHVCVNKYIDTNEYSDAH